MLIINCKGGTGHRKCQDGICDVQKGTSDNVKSDVVEKDKGEGKIMDVKKYLDDKVNATFNSADYDPTKSMYDVVNRLYSFSKVEGKDKKEWKCSCGMSSTCEMEPLKSEKKGDESNDNTFNGTYYDPKPMYDEVNRLYSFFKVEGEETKTEDGKKECKCDCGKSSTCEAEPLKSEKKDSESIDNPKGALSIIYTFPYHVFRLNGQVARFKDVMEGIEAIPYGTLDKVQIYCPEQGNNGTSHTPYCADELVPFFNEVYRLLRHGGCFKATSTPRQMNGIAYIFEAMKLKILEKKYEGGEFTISGIKVNRYDDEGY